MRKWLRSLGKAGEITAAAITLIESKLTWAVVVSAAFGTLAALWAGLFDFFSNQHTQVALGVFLAVLWTYVGVRVLRSFREPIHTLPKADYRYCINPEGLGVVVDPKNPHLLSVSVVYTLRNVGNWPIRVRVEKFDLRIEDRAAQEPDKNIEMVIPRASARGIQSGGFKKDVIEDRNNGTLNLTIVYGDPDGPFVRKYSAKAKLAFIFFKNEQGDVIGGNVSFQETPVEEDVQL